MNQFNNPRSEASNSPLVTLLTHVKQGLWWIVLVLGVTAGVFIYKQPIREPVELVDAIKEATVKRAALQIERDRIANRIEWLKSEPSYLEIAARDELNKKKAGETIVRFHN